MTDNIPPIVFDWDGEAMVPRHPGLADRHYVVGQSYRLIPHEDRSVRSHRHYFACINDAWSNLPEHLAERLPTPDHLRKYALIKAGYRDERSIVAASKAEAQRLAAFMKPMDDYAVIVAREAVVTVYTAKSQSMKAMGKKTFMASKDAVLDVLSQMIGTSREALAKNAQRAA